MFDVKGYVIKQMAKVKIIESDAKSVLIQAPKSLKVENEYKEYESIAKKEIKLLDGVQEIDIDYDKKTLRVWYDKNKLNDLKILKWIKTIIDIGIENSKFIEENYENNLMYVIDTIEKELIKKKGNIYK